MSKTLTQQKGESEKERQERCQSQLLQKQRMLQKMFKQTEEIDKIKQIRNTQKNDDQFFKLQNELVSNIKRQKDKLIKQKSFLKQLTIKLELDEEKNFYLVQDQNKNRRPYTTQHNNRFQNDPQQLQQRLDNCLNQIQITQQEIMHEQEIGENLQQESIQIFKINCSLKKKFEQSQDVEYIQKVKFQNLENFSMGIQQKQVISNINLIRCQREFQEMIRCEDKGKEKKNYFNQTLKSSVKVGIESISKNLIQQDDLKISIQEQYQKIKSFQQRLDEITAKQYNSLEKKNQVKTILCLKQIFINNNPYAFIQKLERDDKLIDNIFDINKIGQKEIIDKSETVESFFKNHTTDDLRKITDQIIQIFQNMNYKMTSLKNEYMDQSQSVLILFYQYIKFKEKYEKCYSQLSEIIDKNLFIADIGDNPQKQQQYEKTYFDFISVDSGLITNNQNNNLETINIMIINRQEQDSEIVKYTNVTYEQEYLLLAFYNAVQLLLKKFNQNFQVIQDSLKIELPSGIFKQNDVIIDFFTNNINNEVSIEAMTLNKEDIDKKLLNVQQPTRHKLIQMIQNNSLYYSMLNSNSLDEFCKSIDKDINIDQGMGNIAALAYQQCQIKVKQILNHILGTHNILKEEGQATIKKIKLINMYQQTSENRKENISENVQNTHPIYSKLKKTHEIIVKRLEDRKDNKNDQQDDQEIFKSIEIKKQTQDDYENLKMLIDTSCMVQQDSNPASKYYKSQKQLRFQFEVQNKYQHEKNEEQIKVVQQQQKTDQDFMQFQREQMKELIAETDRPLDIQAQAVSKQLQMVNDHLLMKNQFKNENIKNMKQDLKYIQKIDKLYNLSKSQLEKESVFVQTQQDRKNIQRTIQQDSRLIDNEICLRISTIQTAASLNRKKEIIFQRQKIRDAQTQDLFYRSMHQLHDKKKESRKFKSTSKKFATNITELKNYF